MTSANMHAGWSDWMVQYAHQTSDSGLGGDTVWLFLT
jgi:hypothetical protein